MKEQKKFSGFVDEMKLVELHSDIVDALQSDDAKFIESVAIRTGKAIENIRRYGAKGNDDACGLMAFFSIKLLTDLTDRAFKVKKQIII